MSKISELADGGALQSTDYLVAVRSGGNVKVQPAGMTFSSATLTTVDINGGTIDGVTIGGSSAGAGSFTTLNTSGSVVFNEAGADVDFRVEGDSNNALFIVDASTDRVGVGTSGPVKLLEVGSETGSATITPTEMVISTRTVASDFGIGASNEWGILGFYKTDTSGGGPGNVATIGASMANALGSYGNLHFKLANPSSAFAFEEWLTLQNSASSASRQVNVLADGGLYVENNVGIGTDSPSYKTTVEGESDGAALSLLALHNTGASANTEARLILAGGNGLTTRHAYIGAENEGSSGGNAHALVFGVNEAASTPAEAMRIDSSGNVGIGTSSPVSTLTLPNDGMISWASTACNIQATSSGADYIKFTTNGSEAARIDSSGNLLVGKTSGNTIGTAGIEIDGNNNRIMATRDGNEPLLINRLTSDGTLVDLKKDGTTVGSIVSVSSTDIMIGTSDTGLRFVDSVDAISPCSTNGNQRDDAIDLGRSAFRFDDIYATNGTIQTSDANEKQDIEELSEAERRVAVAAKGLLRKFRWISSVEDKGDDARIHFGIIAQDLESAFEAEGLDAGRYAMFIHSTWTDEETGEERSRMGVRYSELLAFIIAAL